MGPLSCSSALSLLVPPPAEPSHHPSAFATETSSDWEPLAESEERASPSRPATPGPVLGKAVVKGLRDSQHLQWEVSFELGPPGPERGGAQEPDLWSETFHHLAARAIIRDFEQLAEREGEIEQGERSGPAPPRGPTPSSQDHPSQPRGTRPPPQPCPSQRPRPSDKPRPLPLPQGPPCFPAPPLTSLSSPATAQRSTSFPHRCLQLHPLTATVPLPTHTHTHTHTHTDTHSQGLHLLLDLPGDLFSLPSFPPAMGPSITSDMQVTPPLWQKVKD